MCQELDLLFSYVNVLSICALVFLISRIFDYQIKMYCTVLYCTTAGSDES